MVVVVQVRVAQRSGKHIVGSAAAAFNSSASSSSKSRQRP